MRSPDHALAAAHSFMDTGYNFGPGHCLGAVRQEFDASFTYNSAADNWNALPDSQRRHSWPPAAGYPIWWLGGGHGFGHVVISDGDGYCLSTDFTEGGYVGDGLLHRIHINSIAANDSALHYQGWSTQIENEVLSPPAPTQTQEWYVTDEKSGVIVGYGTAVRTHTYSVGRRTVNGKLQWFAYDNQEHSVVGYRQMNPGRTVKIALRTV